MIHPEPCTIYQCFVEDTSTIPVTLKFVGSADTMWEAQIFLNGSGGLIKNKIDNYTMRVKAGEIKVKEQKELEDFMCTRKTGGAA